MTNVNPLMLRIDDKQVASDLFDIIARVLEDDKAAAEVLGELEMDQSGRQIIGMRRAGVLMIKNRLADFLKKQAAPIVIDHFGEDDDG